MIHLLLYQDSDKSWEAYNLPVSSLMHTQLSLGCYIYQIFFYQNTNWLAYFPYKMLFPGHKERNAILDLIYLNSKSFQIGMTDW